MNREALLRSIAMAAEIEYARSGGPGGQNVNKVNSKAIARIALDRVEGLSAEELSLVRQRLASRLTLRDELVVQADQERDQARNREAALARLTSLIAGAAQVPRPRRATRPTRASKERRLAVKRLRSDVKQHRGRPEQP